MSNLKSKLLGGSVWAGAGKLVSMASNFLLTIMLVHALSPSHYGIYFVALSTIVIIASVGTLGMDRVVVRFAAIGVLDDSKTRLRHVIYSCVMIVILVTVIVSLLFWVFAPHFFVHILDKPELSYYVGLLATWIFFATLQRQTAESFRGMNDVRLATLFGGVRNAGIINSLLACVAMFGLWLFGELTLATALSAMLAVSILVVTLGQITLWRKLRGESPHRKIQHSPSLISVKSALQEGLPLWLATIIVVLNSLIGAWLASAFDTSAHVALYGVAQRFMLLLLAPMVLISQVLPPVVSQLHNKRQLLRLERILRSMTGLVLLPALFFLLILIVAGHQLLNIVFGSYYVSAYPILLILCFGQIFNVGTGGWQIVLPMTGKNNQMLFASIVAIATQLCFGIIFGLYFGVIGIAVGFCMGTIATNVVGMLLVHHTVGIWTHASFSIRTIREVLDFIRVQFFRKLKSV